MKYVGKNIPRNDGFDKATGLGQFTMDVSMPHMLYARVLRSPYAHAKVVKIDTSAAEALPGVVTVCTFENTTNKPFNTSATMVTHRVQQNRFAIKQFLPMNRSILVTKLLLSQPKPRQSQLKPSSELK